MNHNHHPSDTIKLEIPADVKYLETVSTLVETALNKTHENARDSQVMFAVKLAVHEICVNIIEHAYHGRTGTIQIFVHLVQSPPKIVVELCDQGDPADPAKFVPPNLEEPQVKGYGLYLVKNLVDSVDYSRTGGTNQWTIIKAM